MTKRCDSRFACFKQFYYEMLSLLPRPPHRENIDGRRKTKNVGPSNVSRTLAYTVLFRLTVIECNLIT